jgi:hypothetical protein
MENNTSISQLQDFQAKLNREPNPAELGKTPDGKARTLPISFIEMTLDELFLGQWETSEPTYQQVFNEVVGSLVLTVWHPITNRPIRRVGFASVVITQDKDATISEFNATKKKNALDLSFPKLKSECTKNAAQSLGKIFGRDLNRTQFDTYNPVYKKLSDVGFKALLDRVESGDWEALELAQSNFILSEIQQDILEGHKPKLLNGTQH